MKLGKNKETKRLIPQKDRKCPDYREIATKSGAFVHIG
jgi:hypothetical protein